MCLRAIRSYSVAISQNIDVRVSLRTGDKAIIAGALAIAAYEKYVHDDADLISSRVSVYRTHVAGRLVTDAVILATALHLAEWIRPDWDLYHVGVRYIRRNVGAQE